MRRRTAVHAIAGLCLAAIAVTSTTNALSFDSDDAAWNAVNSISRVSSNRAVSADSAIVDDESSDFVSTTSTSNLRRGGTTTAATSLSTTTATTTSTMRPHTADEDVELAEAALDKSSTFGSSSSDAGVVIPTVAPTPSPKPTKSTAVPATTKPASSAISTTDRSASKEGEVASTPKPKKEKNVQSVVEAEELSGTKTRSAERDSESNLDQTIVLFIVAGVGMIGATVLLVSRSIKNMMEDDDSDDEM